MIQGSAFGAPAIPEYLIKRLGWRKRLEVNDEMKIFCLAGMCDTDAEKHQMTMQADNGRRLQFWFKRRLVIDGKLVDKHILYTH